MARATRRRKPTTEQLNLLTEQAIKRASARPQIAAPAVQPAPEIMPLVNPAQPARDRGAFGAWLLRQHLHRLEWVAALAKTAKADPRFPKQGSVEDVQAYLTKLGADGDAFEALDDAEMDWLAA